MEVMSLTAPSSQRKFTSCFLSAPTSPRRITEWYREYEEEAKKKLLRTFFDSFRLGRESRQSEEDH
ncbi:hypothetical protein HID58_084155 [Brassica napus]|uniref:Uncharacterized protein n=3 Tax=Brassica TaxID=3705 RepID=A0ABQ7XIZ0_BRANA|nr:hypothetical protein Bca52824_081437 [Brassica carinata]KAH0855894.1 hypothetical protein HID58_084155 [Brassica napus]VDD37562.1 unnamed protein product [Brassica oleracea]VDD61085.1 unnamed protein product [Brassica oleracea]